MIDHTGEVLVIVLSVAGTIAVCWGVISFLRWSDSYASNTSANEPEEPGPSDDDQPRDDEPSASARAA